MKKIKLSSFIKSITQYDWQRIESKLATIAIAIFIVLPAMSFFVRGIFEIFSDKNR